MNLSKNLTKANSTCRKLVIRTVAVIGLLMLSVPVFAQNLAIKNFGGDVVGWLLWKNPGTPWANYMTPHGDILTLSIKGATSNTMHTLIKKLVFESDDCSGQALIVVNELETALNGEVFQVGEPEDSIHARMPMTSININRDIGSEKTADGDCSVFVEAGVTTLIVEEVDPLDYGITESDQGVWKVKFPSWEIQLPALPEVISCDGFESCEVP